MIGCAETLYERDSCGNDLAQPLLGADSDGSSTSLPKDWGGELR